MTETKILTDECISRIAKETRSAEPGRDGYVLPFAFARVIEQAVLQSPEIQARRWQPIDTAPKDGTWIAAWRNIEGLLIGDPFVFVCWFDFDDEPGWAWPSKPYNPWTFEGQEQAIQCIEEGDWYSSDEFTHWMPLPAPPSDAAMEKQP